MITKSISIPVFIEIEKDIVTKVSKIIKKHNLFFSRALIVSGPTKTKNIADEVSSAIRTGMHVFSICVHDSTLDEVKKVKNAVELNGTDVILGIGGGRVLDVCKQAAFERQIAFISIPTSIANDGIASPISVLKDSSDSKTRSMGARIPTGIIADISIILKSPYTLLQAGIGDLLSNISASYDWDLAVKRNKSVPDELAKSLALNSTLSVVNSSTFDMHDTNFIRKFTRAQILSGIAMGIAGSSRPCSGSEHLISHAIDDIFGYGKVSFHGIQVAVSSLFILELHGALKEKYLDFAKRFNIPTSFSQLGLNKKQILQILKVAPKIRQNRYGILNEVSSTKINSSLEKFL